MRVHPLVLATAIAFASSGLAFAQSTLPHAPDASAHTRGAMPALPSNALSEEEIKQHIASAGYKEVKDLKFEDGVWRSEARGGDNNWTDIAIGAVTGKVYPENAPSALNKDEIKARLAAAGYEKLDDLEFDDGLWSADAVDARGTRVELLADPDDGSVVATEAR